MSQGSRVYLEILDMKRTTSQRYSVASIGDLIFGLAAVSLCWTSYAVPEYEQTKKIYLFVVAACAFLASMFFRVNWNRRIRVQHPLDA